jgi:hypothetical protein
VKGGWSGVDAPDVLGVCTALEGLEDGAGGGGGICIGRDDGAAPGGVCIWAPLVLLGVADADATGTAVGGGGAATLLLLPALVVPLLLPLLVALPLEDLKEDKRFCAEDLRRIERRRRGWEWKGA